MRGKSQPKPTPVIKVHLDSSAPITDFQYNHNGTQLAVADSDGHLAIYHKDHEHFTRTASFRADEAAIWKVSWADPAFGDLIAIATFKRKVAIYQLRSGTWTQIAYHELHDGSVNHTEWAPASYGCKLFSAGSDGSVAILQLKKNSWVSSSFFAHQCSITSLSVRQLPLNEIGEQSLGYPLIASSAKDNSVKVWRHTSDVPEDQLEEGARIYQQISLLKIHKQSIRAVLWKQRWTSANPLQYQLFTCSEDGTVKLTAFVGDKVQETAVVCQFQHPVFRIAQSLTGSLLTVSLGNESEQTYLYQQTQNWQKWNCLEQLQ